MTGPRIARALVVVASLSIIVIVVLWNSNERLSPGPLHGSHARVAVLNGSDGCAACHGAWGESLPTACLSCHEPIAIQLEEQRGLHGSLGSGAEACAACHAEHTGGAMPLVSDRAFALAGVADPSEYRHEHVSAFPLSGAHDALDCSACHRAATRPVLEPGEHRFLGMDTTCSACHEDPHDSGFGGDCASCHGQDQRFDLVAMFEHDPQFPLVGAHAQACSTCHEDPGYSVAELRGGDRAVARGCTACHESPHSSMMHAVFAGSNACAECHAAERRSFERDAALMSDAAHAALGFPLEAPHAEIECAACHDGAAEPASPFGSLVRRAPDACADCHEDPHAGQFAPGPTSGRCVACHDAHRFKPSTFDVAAHALTRLPLVDAHAGVSCSECHVVPTDGVRRFAGTPTACASCHDDPHAGQFDDRPSAGACAACHEATQFIPSSFDLDRHADSSFPLRGAHEAVGCDRCHSREATRGAVMTRFVPTASACADCHEDPHGGRFDRMAGSVIGNAKTGCARCHTDSAKSFAGVRFEPGEHEHWTGFALAGAHTDLQCADCHRPGADPDPRRRAFGRAPTACADCHVDPHAGQFGAARTDCAQCHGVESFVIAGFDHETTSFALDETHAAITCARCHRADRRGVVRYRPIAHRCQDCHGFDRGGGS